MSKATRPCSRKGCPRTYYGDGYCQMHLRRVRKTGDPGPVEARVQTRGTCTFPGCGETQRGKGLCTGHYQQRRRGDELALLRKNGRTDARDDQGRKRCSRCGDWLAVSEFYLLRSNATRDGLSTNCNLCDRLYGYHITAHEFRAMLARQGGACAICRRVPNDFHIDHDHACCPERSRSCGKCIRGLLCPDCNGALGLMADDQQRLLAAAAYLGGGEPNPC